MSYDQALRVLERVSFLGYEPYWPFLFVVSLADNDREHKLAAQDVKYALLTLACRMI